jgi:hypothetical protein
MSFTRPNTHFPYLCCASWVGYSSSLLSRYLFIKLDWYMCPLARIACASCTPCY